MLGKVAFQAEQGRFYLMAKEGRGLRGQFHCDFRLGGQLILA
jgi:hypothetical protein